MFIVFIKIQGRISPINVLQSQKIVFHFVGVLLPCGGFLCVYINPRPRPWLSGCCSYWLYAKKIKFPTSRGNCAQQRYAGRFYTSVWNNNNQGFVFLSKYVVINSQRRLRIAWETNLPCGGLAPLSVETFVRFLILEMIEEWQIFVQTFC